jgi:nicotinamidase-related amidase
VPDFAGSGPTLDATTFSKWGPELASRVGPDVLLLAGVSTDCCVLSTAVAAADAGVPVRVVADACAGVDDRSHAAALHVLALYAPLVEVVDTETVLASV